MADSANTIVTHSGTHHADEALAVFMLRKLPQYQSMPLVRTRDPAVIDQGTIVVDVGAQYDPVRHRYDHHQRGFEETFDAQHSIKLSSAGLVWKHFGTQILAEHLKLPVSDSRVSLLHMKLYDDFVQAIDAIDNGISQYPSSAGQPLYKSKTDLSSRVGYTNPRWNETSSTEDQNARFERASAMAGTEFFDRVNYTFEAWLPAREIVLKALEARKSIPGGDSQGRVLVFDEFASWKDHIFQLESDLAIPQAERALYVVYPDESGKWRIQAVPINPDSFVSRKPLPEPWRGVRDDALTQLTGIEGCVFVHQSGFIGGNATKEGALEMARQAVATVVPPNPLTSPVFPAGARPIVLLGPSNVVAPLPNPDSSVIYSETDNPEASFQSPNSRAAPLPSDLQSAKTPSVRHRFLSLPHPSTGAPTYFVLYKREGEQSSSSSTDGLGFNLNLDPNTQMDGLLELHVIRPENVERSWFVGSTGAIHAPVPGSERAKEVQRREMEEEEKIAMADAQVKAEAEEEAEPEVLVKKEEEVEEGDVGRMDVDEGEDEEKKESQLGNGPNGSNTVDVKPSKASIQVRSQPTRRRKPEFAGQVVSDGAVHMLVPVDPVFLLIPLLSLTAPADRSDLGRFQPADDLFDDMAMSAFRRLAHKHNERVLAQVRSKMANANKNGSKSKGKQRQMTEEEMIAEEGTELLEEEGIWSDVNKFGSSRAGLDALGRICDVRSLGIDMNVYRFNRAKALSVLVDKVAKIATQSVFAGAPTTLGRTYARTLSKLGGDNDEPMAGVSAENAQEQEQGGGAGASGLSREDKVRLQVCVGAVSAWLDEDWRKMVEEESFVRFGGRVTVATPTAASAPADAAAPAAASPSA
ncbi:hypothetical protein A4X13_0g1228 [Tilletia indica]|uniref:Uncharacterized protein n=1 Tax=Tilletia indica TaxID=43049 RepID=A0A177TJN7_9BASI|nr:hypothetical protein A4X13_0g1228 [Tilletia indica]